MALAIRCCVRIRASGLTETMFYAVAGAIAFLLVVIITLLVCCCCTDGEYGYDNDGELLSMCATVEQP